MVFKKNISFFLKIDFRKLWNITKILYNKLLRKRFYQLCEIQPNDIRFTYIHNMIL